MRAPWRALIGLVLLTACPGPRHKDLPGSGEGEALPALSGTLRDGVFHDGRGLFSLVVAEGWAAEPRSGTSTLRVVLLHAQTGTRVELRVFPLPKQLPEERPACRWTFREPNTQTELPAQARVGIATCTPDVPGKSRVFARFFEWDGLGWEIDTVIPDGSLLAGVDASELLMAGLTLGQGS